MSPTNGPEPPLTDEEIKYTRRMIQTDKRVHWLMAMARTTALWVTAVVTAVILAKNFLVETFLGKHP